MASTTIVEYWQGEVDRIGTATTGELDVAKAALKQAQQDEADANAALTASAADVTSKRDQVDAQRRALAAIPMPADGDPLLVAMADALVKWRRAIADNVAKETARNEARAKRERVNDRVNLLSTRLAEARTTLKQETDAAAKVSAWKSAVSIAPLKNIKTAATAVSTAAAETKMKSYFPSNANAAKDLLKQVRVRRTLAHNQSAGAARAAANEQARMSDRNGLSKGTPALRRAHDQAVAALEGFMHAKERLDAASQAVTQVAQRVAPPLTPAQSGALNDPAKKGARETALALIAARDGAANELVVGQMAYDDALLAAQLANPGQTDAQLRGNDPALKTQYDDINDPATGFIKKRDDARAGVTQNAIDTAGAWLAAVPDSLWDEFDLFENAKDALDVLKAKDPADFAQDADNAEQALAANLDATLQQRLADEALAADAKQAAALADGQRELAKRREQAAVRYVNEV